MSTASGFTKQWLDSQTRMLYHECFSIFSKTPSETAECGLEAFFLPIGRHFRFWHLFDARKVSRKFGMTHRLQVKCWNLYDQGLLRHPICFSLTDRGFRLCLLYGQP